MTTDKFAVRHATVPELTRNIRVDQRLNETRRVSGTNARVSTLEQDAALQHDALGAAGCFRTWTDTASGALTDRPELLAVMDAVRPGDTLVVWRLDRLGRSLPHLIETVRGWRSGGGVPVVAGVA